jgi:cytochrome b involved in lipid metabolism
MTLTLAMGEKDFRFFGVDILGSQSQSQRQQSVYTREEVAQHNTAESCWLIVDKNVYDATPFLDRHPAGRRAILRKAGKDVTEDYNFHSRDGKKQFEPFLIGVLNEEIASCVIS